MEERTSGGYGVVKGCVIPLFLLQVSVHISGLIRGQKGLSVLGREADGDRCGWGVALACNPLFLRLNSGFISFMRTHRLSLC